MTEKNSRVTDIGIGYCSAHSSPVNVIVNIITGANSVKTNGLATANRASIGLSSCGHLTSVLTYSNTVKAENEGIHRVGDKGKLPAGIYTMVKGSDNVSSQ